MWDNNAPLQLLKTMPKKLNQENLEKIQLLIDADKYKNSIISGFDLCGIFAPFCRGCDKTSIYPCAVSYIRMLQADGMEIEIDASPNTCAPQPFVPQIDIPKTKPASPAPRAYEKKPLKKPYERKLTEPKPAEVKPLPQKYYEPVISEQKASAKKTDILYNVVAEPEIAVAEDTAPITEEIIMEEKEKTPEIIVVAEEPVSPATEQLPEKTETEKPAEPRPAAEPALRKLRIAVARRKLQ